MTSINVELNERKVVIEIAEILSTREEGPADLPEMVVRDTTGKEHVLSSIDFSVSLDEWNQIKPGTKIQIGIKEEIASKKII